MWAAEYGNVNSVAFLLIELIRGQENLDLKTKTGATALTLAAQVWRRPHREVY